jgi:ethanolamine utilization protein EutQ (cupin superfamily)
MFKFLNKEKEPQDVKEVLVELRKSQEKIEVLSKKLDDLEKKSKLSIQKVGIVRFNPFNEVGSNQSFSLALLDENNNGIVITSLYTRQENRIYGKPIKAGESEYVLSNEERQSIKSATKENGKTN